MINVIYDSFFIPIVTTIIVVVVERLGLLSVSWMKERLMSIILMLANFDRIFSVVFFSLHICVISYALNDLTFYLTMFIYFCSNGSLACASH